jgi:predicted metalloprotease with PDZ domain
VIRPRRILFILILLAGTALAAPPVDYYVSLAGGSLHLVRVRMHLAGTSGERDIQMPVWNALYQIRDFAQYVRWIRARDASGHELPIRKLDKTTWRISHAESGAEIEYEVYANDAGPYGAYVDREHAFLNLAEVLMYAVDARDAPVTLTFVDVPKDWRIATALPSLDGSTSVKNRVFTARDFDRLVDGPVDIGDFREKDFDEGGARYRVVVDADPQDYNLDTLAEMVHKVVASEVEWMQDRPFTEYLFLYHFPHSPGGGGMEHAYSTAIDVSADRLADDPLAVPSVTAHEFFHLWNVKRIRPASLEPIDYTKENYTRALWFSEGVTSTVADLTLVRAGIMSEQQYLTGLSHEIRALEMRPAHKTQSVEEASLDTWFDKYPQYRLPERSISYYNKGEIVGVLLDLALRQTTNGQKSLRDLFHWMNDNFAHQARYFNDSEGVRQGCEALTGTDFKNFFAEYVAGTEELPYDAYFQRVGLRLEVRQSVRPEAGFVAVRNFNAPPVVVQITPGSEAESAGLVPGDAILMLEGKFVSADLSDLLAHYQPGDTIHLRVTGRKGTREIKLRLGSRQENDYALVDVPNITPLQRARRKAWLLGVAENVTGQ